MKRLILTRGLPGSGKTTWALAQIEKDSPNAIRVNRDEIRNTLFGKYVLNSAQENIVTTFQHDMIKQGLKAGFDVYVDDTNLNASFVKKLINIGNQYSKGVLIKDFTGVSVETCLKNIAKRVTEGGRDVPAKIVQSMYDRYIGGQKFVKLPDVPDYEIKPYEAKPDGSLLPWAVIVDIDGTIAKMAGRSPYEWKRVGEDTPVRSVMAGVKALETVGYKILFTSGRDGSCRPETEAWLAEHYKGEKWKLLMREAKDMRPDWIVKAEIFDNYIRGKYNVEVVFDDRQQVVDMWRKMGLTVYQVAEGNF